MNLDDESQLSAYLDDELDPADRLAVEWSVESSVRLADQLRSIALARDAVAGLDRPAIPRDLAPTLGALIVNHQKRSSLRSIARPAQLAIALSSFSTIAASLIFALIRLNQSLHETPEVPIAIARIEQDSPLRTHPPVEFASVPVPSQPAPPVVLIESDPSPRVAAEAVVAADSPVESADRDARRVIGAILGRPHVRRIVIVTDVVDASERVKDLIRQDARQDPEFGRISICQEIIIDPDRVEPAEVFAVPIDERGRRSFVDRLQKLFPDLIEEGQSSPQLVTQLTEVGQVAVFRGLQAAPLGEPPINIRPFVANREKEPLPPILEAHRNAIELSRREKPGPLDPPQAPRLDDARVASLAVDGPEFVGPPDIDQKAPPRPGERVTLLVWVTRPGRH